MTAKIYHFDHKQEQLKKARAYVEDFELMLEDEERAVPALMVGLRHGEPELRSMCLRLLADWHKRVPGILEIFYEMMTDPTEDPDMRDHIAINLGILGGILGKVNWLQARLLDDLNSEDEARRRLAAQALGWQGNSEAIFPLVDRLSDPSPEVRWHAALALSYIGDNRVLDLLLKQLAEAQGEERIALLSIMHRFDDERAVQAVLAQLSYPDPQVRLHALAYAGAFFEERTELDAECLRLLADPDVQVRQLAVKDCGRRRIKAALPPLKAILTETDMETRRLALKAIRQIRGQEPVSEWD